MKESQEQEEEVKAERKESTAAVSERRRSSDSVKRKLSFNERREKEALEREIETLEQEKAQLEQELCSGTLPVNALTAHSTRIGELLTLIDRKSTRWFELSEIEN